MKFTASALAFALAAAVVQANDTGKKTLTTMFVDVSEHHDTLRRLQQDPNAHANDKNNKAAVNGLRRELRGKKSKSDKSGKKSKSSKAKGSTVECDTASMFREGEDLFIAPTYCSGECLQENTGASVTIETCLTTNMMQMWDITPVDGTPAFNIVGSSGLCLAAPNCDEDSGDSIVMTTCTSPLTQWLYIGTALLNWGCWTTVPVGQPQVGIDFDACSGGEPYIDDDLFYYSNLLVLDQCVL